MNETTIGASKTGRPQSITPDAFDQVRKLQAQGYGFRKIANLLADQGVFTTKSSVERMLKGLESYA